MDSTAPSPCTVSVHAERKVLVSEASQLHPAQHNPLLMELVELKVSWGLIEYMANFVVTMVAGALNTRGVTVDSLKSAFLMDFIARVIHMSRANTAELLVALVYIERTCADLVPGGSPDWVCERIFFGSLILSTKYVKEVSFKGCDWALCSGVFSARDVMQSEWEVLQAMDFKLRIREQDLLRHYGAIMMCCMPDHWTSQSATRVGAVDSIVSSTDSRKIVAHNSSALVLVPPVYTPSPTFDAMLPSLYVPGSPDSESERVSPVFEALKPEYRPQRRLSRPLTRDVMPAWAFN